MSDLAPYVIKGDWVGLVVASSQADAIAKAIAGQWAVKPAVTPINPRNCRATKMKGPSADENDR